MEIHELRKNFEDFETITDNHFFMQRRATFISDDYNKEKEQLKKKGNLGLKCGLEQMYLCQPPPEKPKKNIDVFQEMIRQNVRLLRDKFKTILEWVEFTELQIMKDDDLIIKNRLSEVSRGQEPTLVSANSSFIQTK